MPQTEFLRAACSTACRVALLLALPAWAADDAVIVTAPRFAEDLRRLPASVTVLDAEAIAQSAARTLPELLSEQVGLNARDLFGNNGTAAAVDLRGYGVTASQNTLILLDGRRLNDFDLSGVQWSAIPLSNVERIEILRGSGAVLHGDGASAGVINIVSRSPLKRGPRFEASGRVASFDSYEGQLYGSLVNDTLGVNATLYGYTSNGYRDNNQNDQRNASANLRWALGEGALDLQLGADRQDLRLPGGRRVQPSTGLDQLRDDRRGTNTPDDYAERDGNRAAATLTQRIDETELTIGLEYRDKDLSSFALLGGFAQYRDDDLELASFTPRLRLPFVTGSLRHRLTVGVDLHRWRYDSRRSDRPENVSRPSNRVDVEQKTEAVYLQDVVEIGQATIVSLGYRAARAKYDARDRVDTGAPGCFFCAAAPAASETQSEDAWEIGVRHALDAAWTLIGRAGRSYRFVNAEEIYEFNAFFAPEFQILRPQHAITYEAGVEWRARSLWTRALLFQSDITDEIHLDPFTSGIGNRNLPPSRRRGVELEARWRPAAAWQLGAAYAYTDARYREGVLPGGPFAIGTDLDIAGKRVPLVPEHKLNLSALWNLDARTQLSAALTALSSQFMDNDEPNTLGTKIPAYTVVDLKLARRFDWGRLALSVNNLFDEDYYSYAVRSAFTPDLYEAYPLPGRSFGLSAEIRVD
ncbi:MAG TPA: TonB-dependent receptor [Burkholderiales bacterium]|nr:TonB-dependent receptor [Burkholderiales bacterium]